MLAVASGQVENADARLLGNGLGAGAPPRSLGAVIRHGVVIGTVAAALQILAVAALLYAAGIIGD